jgi:hypothetical protein
MVLSISTLNHSQGPSINEGLVSKRLKTQTGNRRGLGDRPATHFRKPAPLAGLTVANIQARAQRELVLKCALAAIYEDGKPDYLRRAMEACQVISISAMWETARLLDLTCTRQSF